MLIFSKHSGYRAGIRLYPGSKGGGNTAAAPDPALIAAQIKSMGIQDAAVQQIQQNSADLAPMQKEQLRFALDTQHAGYDQTQDDRKFMVGRRQALTGLQDTLTQDAKDFDTEGRANELAGRAAADVNQGFADAKGQSARSMARMGVNPSSGRAAAMDSQMAISQAAALAGASTNARTSARQEGRALTDRATNALAGYPAMGMQATGSGAGIGASGISIANTGLAGLNSGSMQAGTMAGQTGQNAAQMYGAMGSYKNGQDQINQGESLGSILGGLGGLAMGAAKMGVSDRRLKENIKQVGSDPGTGLNLYEFNYKTNPATRFIGVMADEVEPLFPDAVMYGRDGFASVDYGSLGIEMVEV